MRNQLRAPRRNRQEFLRRRAPQSAFRSAATLSWAAMASCSTRMAMVTPVGRGPRTSQCCRLQGSRARICLASCEIRTREYRSSGPQFAWIRSPKPTTSRTRMVASNWSTCRPPDFFVHVSGSTATNASAGFVYPNVGKPLHSVPGNTVQLNMERRC